MLIISAWTVVNACKCEHIKKKANILIMFFYITGIQSCIYMDIYSHITSLLQFEVKNDYTQWQILFLNSSPLLSHICVSESGQHWLDNGLSTIPFIANWTHRIHLQWNFDQNVKYFIHGNAYKNGGHFVKGEIINLYNCNQPEETPRSCRSIIKQNIRPY